MAEINTNQECRKERIVGINGFGRIGRAIFRILLKQKTFDVLVINDINPDNSNIAYQLKYDSLFGILDNEIKADGEYLRIDDKIIRVYHEENVENVPWEKHGVTRVIEASGVQKNYVGARKLEGKVKQVVITHSPAENLVDKFIIMGINQDIIDVKKDFLISGSICDANAFGPIMHLLEGEFGVEHGFLTTLHPWLSYQNLLDGPSVSFGYPGQIHSNYTLGRASTFSLLPKPTTTVEATCKVLKHLNSKFHSFSFRVPTAAVSCSDITVKLSRKTNIQEVRELFETAEKQQKYSIFKNNDEPLVSVDFKGSKYSAIIDWRWACVKDENYLKLVTWYDNEWGYSYRIVDLVELLFVKEENNL